MDKMWLSREVNVWGRALNTKSIAPPSPGFCRKEHNWLCPLTNNTIVFVHQKD